MEYDMSKLIEQLREKRNLTDEQLKELIETDGYDKELFASAVDIREKAYGRDVYIRGLIEISSYCKNDCYYCGIRRSNEKAQPLPALLTNGASSNAACPRVRRWAFGLSCCRAGRIRTFTGRAPLATIVANDNEAAYPGLR